MISRNVRIRGEKLGPICKVRVNLSLAIGRKLLYNLAEKKAEKSGPSDQNCAASSWEERQQEVIEYG